MAVASTAALFHSAAGFVSAVCDKTWRYLGLRSI